jgi:hypothetical protein
MISDLLEAGFWPSSGGPITHPQSVIDLPESSFLTYLGALEPRLVASPFQSPASTIQNRRSEHLNRGRLLCRLQTANC